MPRPLSPSPSSSAALAHTGPAPAPDVETDTDSGASRPRPTKLARMSDALDITHATTQTLVGAAASGSGSASGSVADAPSATFQGSNGDGNGVPMPSYRPDAKARRYDRQLRLWASAGQRSLESARVLLLGCDALGCQALKNLVLPGIAQFTILSDERVKPVDVGSNFFLHPSCLGQSLAESAVKYLKELNPAVEGVSDVRNPSTVLSGSPDYFSQFTLVIASNIHPKVENQIADLLWQASATTGGPDVPLISIRSSGFIGKIEIQVREHCISDTHPDTTHTLRIDRPFPALEKYARELDLETMDSMEHSHVPWVVLLVRAGCEWRDKHDGTLPKTYEEKDAFKAQLKAGMRHGEEENYQEALQQAYRIGISSEAPDTVPPLLELDSVKHVSSSSKNLHLLLNALSTYLSQHSIPPTSPTLPDMHSSTTSYIALQNLYKAEYQSDLAKFSSILSTVLQGAGLDEGAVPKDEIESFVRNVGGVGIIVGSKLSERRLGQEGLRSELHNVFNEEWELKRELALYLALCASEVFYTQTSRWPGTDAASAPSDAEALASSIAAQIQSVLGQSSAITLPDEITDSIAEVTRGGFGCLPNTAAMLGGVVAQEAIKLVTNQYMPLDNTAVFDLVKSASEKFKL